MMPFMYLEINLLTRYTQMSLSEMNARKNAVPQTLQSIKFVLQPVSFSFYFTSTAIKLHRNSKLNDVHSFEIYSTNFLAIIRVFNTQHSMFMTKSMTKFIYSIH